MRALALAAALAALPASAAAAEFGWLAGCWRQDSGATRIEEAWTPAPGGAMAGVSRTHRDGALKAFEYMTLRREAAGWVFEARPSGQPGGVFPAIETGAQSVLFENRAHDFPQRIGYRLVAVDRLHAWIDGTVGGQSRRVDFHYRRIECPPAPGAAAAPEGEAMQIERFEQGPRLAQAVVAGEMVYLAGQVADDLSQSVEGQTRQVLAEIDRVLALAGSDRSRIVSVTIYLADIGDFAAMNAAWDTWVPASAKPARATVQAALYTPACKVEMQVVAVRR